ncbi:MAG: hypothetical protein JW869_06405 [Candidatus Omnitrophica bacterium]|nr:hypothetical protein [Candidatus Omnitrophota bacterium]
MVYWAPFLHFYQPPTQIHSVLKKVCDESYRPLLKMLKGHPHAKVTINMCAVLTEMLNEHGAYDIIENINELAQNNQIEFVDSAKYHPILPLVPKKEIRRQIELNHKANSFFFGKSYKTQGFFSPEMCYSDELVTVLSGMAYRWILISGVASLPKWPMDVICKIPLGVNGIAVLYRDDILSNKISFQNIDSEEFIAELLKLGQDKEDIYIITAMDGETFGHHIQNWEKLFLAEVYEMIEGVAGYGEIKQRTDLAATHQNILESKALKQIKVVKISELLEKFPLKDAKAPKPSSWSTTAEEIKKANYYPLWKDPGNIIHDLQWQHINLCFELMDYAERMQRNEESNRFYYISRALLDRAIHSCQFWWANKKRGMWDINLINKGLLLQEEVILNVYKSIKTSEIKEQIKAELYYKVVASRDIANKIRDQLFST